MNRILLSSLEMNLLLLLSKRNRIKLNIESSSDGWYDLSKNICLICGKPAPNFIFGQEGGSDTLVNHAQEHLKQSNLMIFL